MQLLPQTLCARQHCHQHLVKQVILLQEVLVRQLQLSPRRQSLFPVHHHILTQEVPHNLILFFEPIQGQVDGDKRHLQAPQQLVTIEGLFRVLGQRPEQILVAKLIYLCRGEGFLQLFVYLFNFFLHFLLRGSEGLKVFFHRCFFVLGLFALPLQPSLNFLSLFFDLFQLCAKLLEPAFEPGDFLVLLGSQFAVQLVYLLSRLLLSISDHLPPHEYESPSHILSPDFLQDPDGVAQLAFLSHDNSGVFNPKEGIAEFASNQPGNRPQSFPEAAVDLVLFDLCSFSDFLQHTLQNGSLLAQHKVSYQLDSSTSLLLQNSPEVLVLFPLEGQRCSPNILKTIPLVQIFSPSEYPLNRIFDPFLYFTPSRGEEAQLFEHFGRPIDEQSVSDKEDEFAGSVMSPQH